MSLSTAIETLMDASPESHHSYSSFKGLLMRYICYTCKKSVSSELPNDSVIRAVLICPECIEKGEILFASDEINMDDKIDIVHEDGKTTITIKK